jgi:hypothetical protein
MPARGSPQRRCSTSIMPYRHPLSRIAGDAGGLPALPVTVSSRAPRIGRGPVRPARPQLRSRVRTQAAASERVSRSRRNCLTSRRSRTPTHRGARAPRCHPPPSGALSVGQLARTSRGWIAMSVRTRRQDPPDRGQHGSNQPSGGEIQVDRPGAFWASDDAHVKA